MSKFDIVSGILMVFLSGVHMGIFTFTTNPTMWNVVVSLTTIVCGVVLILGAVHDARATSNDDVPQ